MGKSGGVSSTFHYHSYIKDSIAVQKRKSYVNDSEEHEKDPHLEDLLVPHHIGDVKSPAQDEIDGAARPKLARPCVSILHDRECPSRHHCEIVESKRCVSFGQVIVREYDMVLGDHPSCSFGPPVSLGWHYLEYDPLDVNEYEYHHSRRRPLRLLCLNYHRRMEMLLKDHTQSELKQAVKEKDATNLQRTITRKLSLCWKVEDLLERAHRKVKKRLGERNERKAIKWNEENELDWSQSKFTRTSSILKGSSNRDG